MNKDEANRKMKYAFSMLNGSASGHPGYSGKKNWQSRQMEARMHYRTLKQAGYHWQAERVRNYRNRLAKKYPK